MIALLAAARAIHFASLMTIFGGSAFAVLLRRAGLGGPPVRSAHLLFLTAASLAVLSGIVWFCLIAGQMSGSWQGSVDPSVLRLAATDTRFGQIFLGRFVALAVLWMICVIRMRPDRPEVWNLAGVLLASLAPISHAAATGGDVPIIRATNDAVHLVTGGFWLGGLIVLMMLVPAHRSQPGGLLGPLRLFSIWGIFVVALLVLTGVINGASILPMAAVSLRSSYFDLLLVKVELAAVMVGLAALNRWHFGPALRNGGESATRNLARSIGGEIGLGMFVVGIVGCLGLMAPH